MAFDKWDYRFIGLCSEIATWSSCFQDNRHVGALTVRDRRVLTTGYNGAPAGIRSCVERQECLRRKLEIPSGTRHELCYAAHAEQNALMQAAKLGVSVEGATLYVTHQPCSLCTRLIINAGIKRVVYVVAYPDDFSHELFAEAGVVLEQMEGE